MDEKTTQMIKERFDALPKMIQEAILSSGYENSLIEIGKKYQLNVEQMGTLELETTLTMMGITATKDFEVELTRELKFDKIKGAQIVTDINEKVFLTIRELLKIMNTPPGEKSELDEPVELEEPIARTVLASNASKNEGEGNKNVLKSAGIEILDGDKRMDEKEIEKNRVVQNISKLTDFSKATTIKTEYSLNNISKAGVSVPKTEPSPSLVKTAMPGGIMPTSTVSQGANLSPSYGIKSDPYRMSPNE